MASSLEEGSPVPFTNKNDVFYDAVSGSANDFLNNLSFRFVSKGSKEFFDDGLNELWARLRAKLERGELPALEGPLNMQRAIETIDASATESPLPEDKSALRKFTRLTELFTKKGVNPQALFRTPTSEFLPCYPCDF